MSKEKNIPALRFPEFKKNWALKTMGEICEIKGGKRIPKGFSLQNENNGHPYITVSDMENRSVSLEKIRFVPEEALAQIKNYKISTQDIFISVAGTLGVVGIVPPSLDNANLTENANKLTNLKCDQYYLLQFLCTENLKKLVENVGTVGAQPKLAIYALTDFKLWVPEIGEQKKIGTFLSEIDKRIDTLRLLTKKLINYKKSISQKLFNQEIRFKDEKGKNYPDWELKKLDEIAFKKSSNISANKIEENSGNYTIYGASGILKKVDFYQEENDYVSIVKDGAGAGRLFYCPGKSSVLGTMEIIKPQIHINTYFLYCLLSTIDFVKYITGSTIPHIYFKDYSQETFGLPSLAEQTKIANFLSAIDDKIKQVNTQLERTKEYKKGLLQQMFV